MTEVIFNEVYAGLYYFIGNKVCTLYIPKIVQPEVTVHPDGAAVTEGETWEGFLGQASNTTAQVSFDLISTMSVSASLSSAGTFSQSPLVLPPATRSRTMTSPRNAQTFPPTSPPPPPHTA